MFLCGISFARISNLVLTPKGPGEEIVIKLLCNVQVTSFTVVKVDYVSPSIILNSTRLHCRIVFKHSVSSLHHFAILYYVYNHVSSLMKLTTAYIHEAPRQLH